MPRTSKKRKNRTATRLIGVAALGLLAALAYMKRDALRGGAPMPDSAEVVSYWYCRTCLVGFALSARECADRVYFVAASNRAARGRPALARSDAAVRCEKCKGPAGAARKCPSDGTIFDPSRSNGRRGVCPQCGWSPLRG